MLENYHFLTERRVKLTVRTFTQKTSKKLFLSKALGQNYKYNNRIPESNLIIWIALSNFLWSVLNRVIRVIYSERRICENGIIVILRDVEDGRLR